MAVPSRIPRAVWILAGVIALAALAFLGLQLRQSRPPAGPPLPILATAPDFAFTAQTGAPLTRADLAGKIWIADFIFTRCAGPCPVMTDRLSTVQRALAGSGEDVRFVSVSVDPAYDSPAVLAKYAARFGADPARWHFLTGDPAAVERFVTKGMLLALGKDGDGNPMHAQKFVVVDAKGNIRAYRDLNDPALIPTLLQDIATLRRESGS